MAIDLISGFQINQTEPADVRTNVQTIAERNALTFKFHGMECFVRDDNKRYRLEANLTTWTDLTAGSGTSGAINVIGFWDADTNTPDISALTLNQGEAYQVSVAGTTNLNGQTNWAANDLAVWDDTLAGNYFKINSNDDVLSVAGKKGAVTLDSSDIVGFAASVISQVLTGISFASSATITAGDTILSALGKLQAQVSGNKEGVIDLNLADGTVDTTPVGAGERHSGTIDSIRVITNSGNLNFTVRIDGVAVTGLVSITGGSTVVTATATAANTYSVGSIIDVVTDTDVSSVKPRISIYTTKD